MIGGFPKPLPPLTLTHISLDEWISRNEDLAEEFKIGQKCDACFGSGVAICACCDHEETCSECDGKKKVPPSVVFGIYKSSCRKYEALYLAYMALYGSMNDA